MNHTPALKVLNCLVCCAQCFRK